jgi:hypothetical protein
LVQEIAWSSIKHSILFGEGGCSCFGSWRGLAIRPVKMCPRTSIVIFFEKLKNPKLLMDAKLNFTTFTKEIHYYELFVPKLNICETFAHLGIFEAKCTRNGKKN